MLTTFRSPIAILLIGMAILSLAPSPASAAGCGTACSMPEAPECVGCQYTFLSRTRCNRQSCVLCIEVDCWVALPGEGKDRLAGQCTTGTSSPSIGTKVVRVRVLPERS